MACICSGALFVALNGDDAPGRGCIGSPLRTLTRAVQCASQDTTAHHEINVGPGTFTESNMTLSGMNMTINGLGAAREVVLDANHSNARIFDINRATVTLSNMVLRNGNPGLNTESRGCNVFSHDTRAHDCWLFSGGAIRVSMGSLRCLGCAFEGNTALNGGAVSLEFSDASFADSLFEQNGGFPVPASGIPPNYQHRPTKGGAIYAVNTTVAMSGTELVGNYMTGFRGAHGGAMYLWKSSASVTGSTFGNNTAEASATTVRGGAVYLNSSTASFADTDFTRNVVNGVRGFVSLGYPLGGAIFAQHGQWPDEAGFVPSDQIYQERDDDTVLDIAGVAADANLNLHNCSVIGNEVRGNNGFGAAMMLWRMHVTGTDCSISDHHALPTQSTLGTVMLQRCRGSFSNTGFVNNSMSHAGALYANYQTEVNLSSCLFERNAGTKGGAVFFGHGPLFTNKFNNRNLAMFRDVLGSDGVVPGAMVADCQFSDNTDGSKPDEIPRSFGGAIFCDPKLKVGSREADPYPITVLNTSFDGSQASSGGAIASVGNTHLVIAGSSFSKSNKALISGDQLYSEFGRIEVQGSSFHFRGAPYHNAIVTYPGATAVFANQTEFFCPNGSLVLQAGSNYMCKPCLAPAYSMLEGKAENGMVSETQQCFECPFGALCATTTIEDAQQDTEPALVTTSVNVSEGHFGQVHQETGRVHVYQCPPGCCCTTNTSGTGCPVLGDMCAMYSNRDPHSVLCSECLEGFSISVTNHNCVKNEECGQAHLYFALNFCMWFGLSFFWIWKSQQQPKKPAPTRGTEDDTGLYDDDDDAADTKAAFGSGRIHSFRNAPQSEVGIETGECDDLHYRKRQATDAIEHERDGTDTPVPNSRTKKAKPKDPAVGANVLILLMFGQVANVLLPSNSTASIMGQISSGEATEQSDSGGWCISKGMSAEDKIFVRYLNCIGLGVTAIVMCAIKANAYYARKRFWKCKSNCIIAVFGSYHDWAAAPDDPLVPSPADESAGAAQRTSSNKKMVACVLFNALAFAFTAMSKATAMFLQCVELADTSTSAAFDTKSAFWYRASRNCDISGWQLPPAVLLMLIISLPVLPLLSVLRMEVSGLSSLGPRTRWILDGARYLVPAEHPFREEKWYWVYILPLHRLLVVIFSSGFLAAHLTPLSTTISTLLYLIFALIVCLVYCPYKAQSSNFLENLCHIVLVLIVMFSIPDSAWASVGKVPEQPVFVGLQGAQSRVYTQWRGMQTAQVFCLLLPFAPVLAFAGGKLASAAKHFVG